MRLVVWIMIFLSGCTLPTPTSTLQIPEVTQTAEAAPLPSQSDWDSISEGLAVRDYQPDNEAFGRLVVVRIDPARYTFRAHYRPGEPLRINEWRDTLPGAVAIINANFFRSNFMANGLLVSDGVRYGTSYGSFGGIFQIENGLPRIRVNNRSPYQGEALQQAVEGFPMLVIDGVAAYTTPDRVTRRSVIAQDSSGQVFLIATPFNGLSLSSLSAYLPTTGLNLVSAINLDGGGSTMLYLSSGYMLHSRDAVPAVLAVYPK